MPQMLHSAVHVGHILAANSQENKDHHESGWSVHISNHLLRKQLHSLLPMTCSITTTNTIDYY